MTLRILQLTDCHLFTDPTVELKGICTRRRFERVLSAVEPEFERADRLIITGDLAHDELPETYVVLRERLEVWWPRVRLLPGNHDFRDAMQAHCGDRIQRAGNRVVFRETLAEWRLIGLDSQLTGEVRGELGATQLDWLNRELTEYGSSHTAIFLHHPPVVSSSPWMNSVGLVDREALWSILRQHSQVRVICAGHVHHELSYLHHGILALATPSTGVQFVPDSELLQIDAIQPGYRLLELEPDGTVRTRVVRVP